jgi:hypothetical protein
MVPSKASAAMPIVSNRVGYGWMVRPMSVASAPISIAKGRLRDEVAGVRADDAAADDLVCGVVEENLGTAPATAEELREVSQIKN